MIYRKLNDLSNSSRYELSECILALYELDVYEDFDEVWFRNRLRHILEIVLTDEAFDRLYSDGRK